MTQDLNFAIEELKELEAPLNFDHFIVGVGTGIAWVAIVAAVAT